MRLPRDSFDRYCMTTEINTPQTYKLIGVYIFSSCQSDFPSLASGQGASRMDFGVGGTLAPRRRPARGEEPKSTGLKATDDGGFPGVRLPSESFDRYCMTIEIYTP